MQVAKTKALISFAVTAKLICVLFSHMQKAGFLTTRLIFNLSRRERHDKPNKGRKMNSIALAGLCNILQCLRLLKVFT